MTDTLHAAPDRRPPCAVCEQPVSFAIRGDPRPVCRPCREIWQASPEAAAADAEAPRFLTGKELRAFRATGGRFGEWIARMKRERSGG